MKWKNSFLRRSIAKDLVSSAGPRLTPADARKRDFCSHNARPPERCDLKFSPSRHLTLPLYEEKKSIPPPEFRRIACDPRTCPNAGGMDFFSHLFARRSKGGLFSLSSFFHRQSEVCLREEVKTRCNCFPMPIGGYAPLPVAA